MKKLAIDCRQSRLFDATETHRKHRHVIGEPLPPELVKRNIDRIAKILNHLNTPCHWERQKKSH